MALMYLVLKGRGIPINSKSHLSNHPKTVPKAQSNIVSAILITVIIILSIFSIYSWGLPLLQKGQDLNKVQTAISGLKELNEVIEQVSQQGGSRYVEINNQGLLRIDGNSETIEYQLTTKAAYVTSRDWVPINENDRLGVSFVGGPASGSYGIKGLDKPGVIVAKATRLGDDVSTRFVLAYRELEDPNSKKGYQIDIDAGEKELPKGMNKLVVRNIRTEEIPGASATGGYLQLSVISVGVE